MRWIRALREVGMADVALVGGKNASLGEMLRHLTPLGVRVPDGFAVTAEGYRQFVHEAGLAARIDALLAGRRPGESADLATATEQIRALILGASFPLEIERELREAYAGLSLAAGGEADVAVRSSATAEDLPTASFAGQLESFLHVQGAEALLDAVRRAFASAYTARAVSYREDLGLSHLDVAVSVGVQRMVRSDRASAGVIFTLDTESGHRGVVLVTSSFGLGELVVQGRVGPDQFYVHKATLREGFRPLVWKKLGAKETRLSYAAGAGGLTAEEVPAAERATFSLTDDDVLELSRWAVRVEEHYSSLAGEETPMDLEWAKDGLTGELFVVQARPETVHRGAGVGKFKVYRLEERATPRVRGMAVGDAITTGAVHVIRDTARLGEFKAGEILVTGATDPDWEPILKIAAGVVTDRGGRTSHAAIVARELGIPAVVGTGSATQTLKDGELVTLSCAEGESGFVYPGRLRFSVEEIDPGALGRLRTRVMLNVGNPEQAFGAARLPSDGVGLARMEFIFAGWVKAHPMALVGYDALAPDLRRAVDVVTAGWADKSRYFVEKLAEGIGTLAAAFHPRPVILRFSDFKTNEYAKLVGGAPFEPAEENPMLGWRGASRYYHPGYKAGFLLEVAAIRRVREVFGLKNLAVMVPFCRTPAEGRQVLEAMREGGLERGRDGLEVYVMAEIPSNIILADAFAELFDGFSIGSNDLTQLTLGIDRDSATVAPLFDERNEAVLWSCARLIALAHLHGCKVGICGQAPSDYPDFAAFLVERGIDSISLSPDALVRTMLKIAGVERSIDERRSAQVAAGAGEGLQPGV